ncbi:DUF4198 domain-containing protein [Mesobacterium pallidum]|uniref:DUF4198 domain-containing protein n=1 Tax=Mesobacterium pallidum TaxID=2872037 RepID=UPI001EE1AD41|nr:DUF4198 domain-containing protein [Mesobacterium pallidum]
MPRLTSPAATFMAMSLLALPAAAHEFWIDPLAYEVAPGNPVAADLRVGEDFDGPSYSYVPRNFTRFELVLDGVVTPVEGRLGDRPALSMDAPGEGLLVVVHQTAGQDLTYSGWDKFESFVTHKDFAWALDRHLERGFTKEKVREHYIRYGKSLIAVGDGAGQDARQGLETEIVALDNPYTDDVSAGMRVQVFYDGALRGDVQVELFDRAPSGEVTSGTYRTDPDGVALLPVAAGHEYLADSVVMREVDGPADGPAWESLWASLTFAVPAE